ncbi:hypothetical protein [Marinagarivorans algicola]|nr:hypothetical protein [Marinagarivorans algicola]
MTSIDTHAQSTSTHNPNTHHPNKNQLAAKAWLNIQKTPPNKEPIMAHAIPALPPISHPQTASWSHFIFWLSAVCLLSYLFVRAMHNEP